MTQLLRLAEDAGLFQTILPPFGADRWKDVIDPSGFVWIDTPWLDLMGKLDSIVGNVLFGNEKLDLRCAVHHLELDVSVPASDFLKIVEPTFSHGLDFIQAGRHQPPGLQLSSLPRSQWPHIMSANQIRLLFHRPTGGEPALVTSCHREVVRELIERFE